MTWPYRQCLQPETPVRVRVELILRGAEFGAPLHLPRNLLACSRCFRLRNRRHFAHQKEYRMEPVCDDCRKPPETTQS